MNNAESSTFSVADHLSTRAAILTPPGRGAVATLAVFGSEATAMVGQLFTPLALRPLAEFPLQQIIFGRWQADANTSSESGNATAGEELVVVRQDEHTVEVHCHGGMASIERLVGSLEKLGCRLVDVAVWRKRVSGDAMVAAAHAELARALTPRTAAILLDQYHGTLSRCVRGALEALGAGDSAHAARLLDEPLRYSRVGKHLTRPWQIAFMGATNVGKSSLINSLLGYRRSLVCDTAGTTRDVLTDITAIDGWPIEVADTAGLRVAGSDIEAEGMRRAQERAAGADLVLLVSDVNEPWTTAHEETLAGLEAPCLRVHNKVDLHVASSLAKGPPADRPAGFVVSALTGKGINELILAVSRQLVPEPPPAGVPVPFTVEQVVNLREAREAIREANLDVARGALECQLRG